MFCVAFFPPFACNDFAFPLSYVQGWDFASLRLSVRPAVAHIHCEKHLCGRFQRPAADAGQKREGAQSRHRSKVSPGERQQAFTCVTGPSGALLNNE